MTNERLDILASNQLNHALYSELFAGRPPPVNAPRFVYLDPRARDFYLDWDRTARDVVAVLRSAAGRNPYDRELSDLVGELSTRSEEFRTYWASHDVRFHVSGVKHFHHPVVGDISLNYERLRARRRHRPAHHDLHRGPRLQVRAVAPAPRELGRDTRTHPRHSRTRRGLTRPRTPVLLRGARSSAVGCPQRAVRPKRAAAAATSAALPAARPPSGRTNVSSRPTRMPWPCSMARRRTAQVANP